MEILRMAQMSDGCWQSNPADEAKSGTALLLAPSAGAMWKKWGSCSNAPCRRCAILIPTEHKFL